MTWEITNAREGEEKRLLKEGWEPFSVVASITSNHYTDSVTQRRHTDVTSTNYIYLRRSSDVN